MSIRWGSDNKSNNKPDDKPELMPKTLSEHITSNETDLALQPKDLVMPPLVPEAPKFASAVKKQLGLPSTIGESTTVEGTISGDADLIILGACTGEINLAHNSLTIGPTSRVKANIIADKIQIEGELTGDVCAREVKILKTGVVSSNITSPRVSVEDGAKIKGSIDMDAQLAQEKFEKFNKRPPMIPLKDNKSIIKDDYDAIK